ncbi:hypothetical protein AB1Y20_000196 [Prymnesium parvum]|uniref:GPI-anchor transamidase n=1 Tax=Prymnesium parvum TaxID=97485 RepID=A0AB34K8B2_PRYPA
MADSWALIASTSTYFHNYRHTANALSMYHAARHLGLPDSRIILMLASELPCDSRNSLPGSVWNSGQRQHDLYPPDVEVDYRGSEVTVQTFLAVLTDRLPPGTAASRRLRSGRHSSLLIYLSGHGGEEFLKFRDDHEMTSDELGAAFHQMAIARRYAEMLVLVDTCQASTLLEPIARAYDDATPSLPPIVALASSAAGENSFSLEIDATLGVALSDRFTFFTHRFLGSIAPDSPPEASYLRELERSLRLSPLMSTVVRVEIGRRVVADTLQLRRFFSLSPALLRTTYEYVNESVGHSLPKGNVRASRASRYARWEQSEAAAFRSRFPNGPAHVRHTLPECAPCISAPDLTELRMLTIGCVCIVVAAMLLEERAKRVWRLGGAKWSSIVHEARADGDQNAEH